MRSADWLPPRILRTSRGPALRIESKAFQPCGQRGTNYRGEEDLFAETNRARKVGHGRPLRRGYRQCRGARGVNSRTPALLHDSFHGESVVLSSRTRQTRGQRGAKPPVCPATVTCVPEDRDGRSHTIGPQWTKTSIGLWRARPAIDGAGARDRGARRFGELEEQTNVGTGRERHLTGERQGLAGAGDRTVAGSAGYPTRLKRSHVGWKDKLDLPGLRRRRRVGQLDRADEAVGPVLRDRVRTGDWSGGRARPARRG